MHTDNIESWRHSHSFGQDEVRAGERKTIVVVCLTAVTMVVEITGGLYFGSLALLADGVHMASHTVALGIALFAYVYARRRASDERFSFGTGKTNALAGFAGATLLAVFALLMVYESVARLLDPVDIDFNPAIAVACVGLLVNAVSVVILGGHHHDHDDHDDHGHHDHHDRDHNLRSAYLHVVADALTSLTAIFALLGAKYFGQQWLDPAMGIVGSALIARWSWGLLRDTSRVLLDYQAPEHVRTEIRNAIEEDSEDRVSDLHVWSIGPAIYAAAISIVSHAPRTPDEYKSCVPGSSGVRHTTIEIHLCSDLHDEC